MVTTRHFNSFFFSIVITRPHVMDDLMEVGMCFTNADLCQTVAQSRAVLIQLV